MKQARRKRARGYLLLEAMASGAILALILGSAISIISAERARITLESNRAKATALAQDLMQQLLADSSVVKHFGCKGGTFNGVTVANITVGSCSGRNCVHNPNNASDPGNTTDDDPAPFPGFDRYYECQLKGVSAVFGNQGKLYELMVRVTYPGRNGQIATVIHKAMRRERWR